MAVGNAFGFSSRLGKVEDSVGDCITTPQCEDKLRMHKELIDNKIDNHSEQINRIEKSQEKWFAAMDKKLDKIVLNGGP